MENRNRIIERLRLWRKNEANKLKLPAYCIFTNSTMKAIVNYNPSNIDELLLIKGVGKKTIVNYGEKIINILNNKAFEVNKSQKQTKSKLDEDGIIKKYFEEL